MMTFILSNWKTSLAGAAAAMILVCDWFGIPIPAKDELLAAVLAALGLAAKDGNVTGGTSKQ
jgi:hypothetical protein